MIDPLDIALVSLKACAVLFFVAFTGYILTRLGVLDDHVVKKLTRMQSLVLLPAMLFTSIGQSLTMERLLSWWTLPAALVTFITVEMTIVYTLSRFILRFPPHSASFAAVMAAFNNCNSFPLALVDDLVPKLYEVGVLTGMSSSALVDYATSQILVYTTFMNIARWSVGYTCMAPPSSPPPSDVMQEMSAAIVVASVTLVDKVPEQSGKTEKVPVDPVDPVVKTRPVLGWKQRLNKILNAPLFAALGAIALALITPIRDLLFYPVSYDECVDDDPEPVMYMITKAGLYLARVAVPQIFLMLGYHLSGGISKKSTHGFKVMMTATLCRMILSPILGLLMIYVSTKYLGVGFDNVTLLVIGLESFSPSAINSATVALLWNYAQDDVASSLTIQYCCAVITQTIWMTVLSLMMSNLT